MASRADQPDWPAAAAASRRRLSCSAVSISVINNHALSLFSSRSLRFFRFLFDLNSTGYRAYRSELESARNTVRSDLLVAGTNRADGGLHAAPAGDFAQFVNGQRRGACYREEDDDTEDSDTEYRRVAKERNLKNMKNRLVCQYEDSDSSSSDQNEQPKYEGSRFNQENFAKLEKSPTVINDTAGPSGSGGGGAVASAMNNISSSKKKRKSRWDVDQVPAGAEGSSNAGEPPVEKKSRVDRSNPEVIRLAIDSFGSANLDEDQWMKVEQQFQIKQVYNEMLAKRAERERLEQSGRFKFEYDSDEDVDGGTWEHKLRKAEMESTRSRTDALTTTTSGRHHIGDFLPPDELKKFMEQHDKRKRKDGEPVTDYQDKKLTEDNKGFQMLQKLGWKDGEGLGASGSGIVNPINK